MRVKSLVHSAIATGLALSLGGCFLGSHANFGEEHKYAGPGCLIELFTLPALQGAALPVVRDTPELAEPWHAVKSARVIYGTWRLFADRDYKGFMGDYAAPADVPLLLPADHLGSLQCIKVEPERTGFGYSSTPR
jgi:hypothetical protein